MVSIFYSRRTNYAKLLKKLFIHLLMQCISYSNFNKCKCLFELSSALLHHYHKGLLFINDCMCYHLFHCTIYILFFYPVEDLQIYAECSNKPLFSLPNIREMNLKSVSLLMYFCLFVCLFD